MSKKPSTPKTTEAAAALASINGKAKATVEAQKAAAPKALSKVSAAAQAAHDLGLGKPLLTKYIDPKLIDRAEGWNPRIDFGELERLAGSIKEQKKQDGHGIINDLRVKASEDKPGRYVLIDGDRRLSAVELLMKKGEEFPLGVPCKVEPKGADQLQQKIRMFTANTGKPFTPIEQAAFFKDMQDAGYTIKQIEKEVGCSDNVIVGALALLTSADELQEAVKAGKITGAMAKSIAVNARGDKDLQKILLAQALDAGTDVKKKKVVNQAIDKARRDKAAKKGLKLKMRALSDEELSALGKSMAEHLTGLLAEADLDVDTDIRKLIKSDVKLSIAATFGALEAFKAAAGMKISLEY